MSDQSNKVVGAEPVREGTTDSYSGRSPTKVQSHHLKRSAIVYVRQSSPQQVVNNQESTARQYALVDLAVKLGWSPDQVEVIDEDQGQSGSTAEGRFGFQRLLAEVGLDHVGIILGIELTRLARSNKDWHQLIELCAIFGTMLAYQSSSRSHHDAAASDAKTPLDSHQVLWPPHLSQLRVGNETCLLPT